MLHFFARPDVLEFYSALPFNYRGDPTKHAAALRAANPLAAYPPVVSILAERPSLLDVGCGTGWLANSAALYAGCDTHGIDFCPTAIERAKQTAALLRVSSTFEVGDLFQFAPTRRFDLVASLGVAHHTDDCLAAVARAGNVFVAEGGRLFIGLYHRFGRGPFLAHFEDMRRRACSEEAMFADFKRLWRGAGRDCSDEVFVRSWFEDQVLHPHETCHTLAEFFPLLDDLGFTLESTSVNGFLPLPTREELAERERRLHESGRAALRAGRFLPGFFVFLARRGAVGA